MSNPFIERKVGPLDTVAFDLIKLEHFIPALKEGVLEGQKNLEKIKKESNPNFETIVFALEHVSDLLDTVSTVYFNMHSAESSPEHSALAGEVSSICSNFSSDIFLDSDLFQQVKKVYDSRATASLTAEQLKLLENTYKAFVRNGALLSSEKKTELRKIDEQLSQLGPKFNDNILKATNAFELKITNTKDLEGLPESAKIAAMEEAQAKGYKDTWLFTLQAPSFIPFLKYAKTRLLREELWRAFTKKCYKDSYDNTEVLKNIVNFKIKRSQILGYKTYADYVLEERMAKNSSSVLGFLEELLKVSKPAAERDIKEVRDFAAQKDGLSEIKPWDFGYYSELLQKEKFQFDEEELRGFFPIDQVIDGVFKVASLLYQLDFVPNAQIKTYHPDVKVYEVHDKGTKKLIGIFYCDFFPRATKKAGAWMTDYKKQGFDENKKMDIPHVSIVCNFSKPTKDAPSLLNVDEVKTLFHEFGHSLHGLLSQCTYKSLSGTSVYWDFVELPSQFMENFLDEKEVLDLFAIHYKTKQKIPESMVQKLKEISKFQAGYFSMRQINFGLLDMSWYTLDNVENLDVEQFELRATEKTRLFEPIPGAASSVGFSHIFGGGYSAGYYSYKWAEVLDADAFEYFKEKGLFNAEVSKKFREFILSKGGTEHPMELYKKFRGREPDPKALLRRDGLI